MHLGTYAPKLDYNIEMNVGDELYSESLGRYNKERFQDTKQGFRPTFRRKLGQFDIRKPDGTLWTQEDANECLKKLPLNYQEPHRLAGSPITSCNIKDCDDPYFGHQAFVRIAEEGELEIRLGTDMEKAVADMIAGSPEVMRESVKDAHSGDTRYVLVDPAVQDKRAENELADKMNAFELFMAMKDDKERMIQIARLFNHTIDPDISVPTLRNLISKYMDNQATTEHGSTYQARFIEYATMPKDMLELRDFVRRGIEHRVILEKPGIYEFNDQPIGATYGQVIEHFRKAQNATNELKIRLREAEGQ